MAKATAQSIDTTPDQAEKVRNGEIAIDRADRIIRDRAAEQRRIAEAKAEAESAAVDAIAHLNFFEIGCQCTEHPCPNRATHIVEIHAIDRCNEAGFDPFGNRVELRCFACVVALRQKVAEQLGAARADTRRYACKGCGAPVAAVGDVVRGVKELR